MQVAVQRRGSGARRPASASVGLPAGFYDRPVVEVAEDLVGCTVAYGGACGAIVETEAYHESEPACHAFAGLTPRTQTLFGEPGRAYVYRSYGIHALLNAVCEPVGVGAAVLIRALEPLEGIAAMRARRVANGGDAAGRGRRTRSDGSGRAPAPMRDVDLCSGPGKLTQALGIWLTENGGDLRTGPITIGPRSAQWRNPPVVAGPRVGITKAVELPWRFCVAGNRNVSSPRPTRSG